MWNIADLAFEIIDDLTSDPVVTVLVSTPDGTLKSMAEPGQQGTTLILRATHTQDARANAIGHGNLMVLAQAIMEGMDFDGLVVRERFGRLGPVRAVNRVPSGSPAVFVLRLRHGQELPQTIDATLALTRRGMTMLQAKRTVEDLLRSRRVFIDVPMVDDPAALSAELAMAGIAAAPVEPPKTVDVRALRERLGLSREQFAVRFGLEIETVRNWEIGRRAPDTTARSYLRVIANDPEHVEFAYAPTPGF